MKQCLIVPLLLFILPMSGFAQWIHIGNVGTTTKFGALTYKDGTLWAGISDVRMSTDLGITWQTKLNSIGEIYGLDFFDRNTGAVACDSGVFITHDQGQTWMLALQPIISSVRFGATDSDIFVGTEFGILWVSNDGGKNWTAENSQPWTHDFVTLPDSSTLAFESNGQSETLGWIYHSTDRGASWQQLPGNTNADSWSFAVAGCNSQTYYVVNEEFAGPNIDSSEFWVTTDAGVNWSTPLVLGNMKMAGALAAFGQCVFLPTYSSGVMRSKDFGQTWKTIGGPQVTFDSRRIVALSENELFAADEFGNLFHTTNSGGDFVTSTATSVGVIPDTIHYSDSIQICATPAIQNVLVSRACNSPAVAQTKITGLDSTYFAAQESAAADTIFVNFSPTENRGYAASLQITLSNDSIVNIPLSGYGKSFPPASISSQSVTDDTIGAIVYIPIILHQSGPAGNLDLSLHFDTSMLVYRGTYLSNGGTNDETISLIANTVRLHFDSIALVTQDSIIGYAQFEIFPDSAECDSVAFDSVSLKSGGIACTTINSSFGATVCSSGAGCGTQILSYALRYGKLPLLNIIPDPASDATFIHTDTDIGEAEIEVRDILGNMRMKVSRPLAPSNPIQLDLSSLPPGPYSVRVLTGNFERMLNMMVIK